MAEAGIDVILSVNDLEAEAIRDLALGAGARVPAVPAYDWGTKPRLGIDPDTLARTVILVECPDPAFEDQLRRSGREVRTVDHHFYPDIGGQCIDRRSRLSSLEQVAALFGVRLNDEQRLIAANDRAFWPGLLSELASRGLAGEQAVEAAKKIRQREIEIRSTVTKRDALSLEDAAKWLESACEAGQVRDLRPGTGDPSHASIMLVRAPAAYQPVLGDAIYLERVDAALKSPAGRAGIGAAVEYLALFVGPDAGAGEADPIALSYSGRGLREALVVELAQDPLFASLALTVGASETTSFLHAERAPGSPRDLVSKLADRLLDETLTGSRPLVTWQSRFYQVLHCTEAEPDTPATPVAAAEAVQLFGPVDPSRQERAYFSPHLAGLVAPAKDAVPALEAGLALDPFDLQLHGYRFKQPDMSVRLTFADGRFYEEPMTDLAVHFAYSGVLVLEWAFGPPFPVPQPDGPLWRALLSGGSDPDGRVRTVADLLTFNELARECYSPYKAPEERVVRIELVCGKGARKVLGATKFREEVDLPEGIPDGWFRALAARVLTPFGLSVNDPDRTGIVFDDRARAVLTAVPVGTGPRTNAGLAAERVLLARYAGLDSFSETHFYTEEFAEAELAGWRYTRFDQSGSKYMMTSHSLALYGFGQYPADVGIKHMETLYRRMFMLGLLYAAVFDVFSRSTSSLTLKRLQVEHRRVGETGRGAAARKERRETAAEIERLSQRLTRLRQRIGDFASGYWYQWPTPQIQGREMFERMSRQLGVEAYYDELLRELALADEMTRLQSERGAKEQQEDLTRLAVGFAAFLGVMAIGQLTTNLQKVGWFKTGGGLAFVFWIIVGAVSGLMAAALRVAHRENLGFWRSVEIVFQQVRDLLSAFWRR